MALTQMPLGASSLDSARVSDRIAPFEQVYPLTFTPPNVENSDAVLTILPLYPRALK